MVKNKQYQDLNNTEKRAHRARRFWQGVIVPEIDGQPMSIFVSKRREQARCKISKDLAKKLCEILQVDAVLLFYSDWLVASGRFAPTNKAKTRTLISMYNHNGERLFLDRKDILGERILGARMHFKFDHHSIFQWIDATNATTKLIINRQFNG